MLLDRAKLLAILSFIFSIPSAYYFINSAALEAVIYLALSDLSDRMASKLAKREKNAGWKPAIRIAIQRCSDAAVFIGFALSGIVPESYGIALLVAAVVAPFWAETLWKRNIRWMFHAAVYLYVIDSYIKSF